MPLCVGAAWLCPEMWGSGLTGMAWPDFRSSREDEGGWMRPRSGLVSGTAGKEPPLEPGRGTVP